LVVTALHFLIGIHINQLASRGLALALAEGLENLFGVDVLSAQEAVETIRAWIRGPLLLP
jgi:hypothetical protein